ncbi:hypothetical protein LXA47_26450, partial [Massilia sp. P8910]|nr:hypothetical protein [Massilia antarctica]
MFQHAAWRWSGDYSAYQASHHANHAPSAQHLYSYAAITAHCADQIAQLMADACRQSGAEARYRYE